MNKKLFLALIVISNLFCPSISSKSCQACYRKRPTREQFLQRRRDRAYNNVNYYGFPTYIRATFGPYGGIGL